MLLTHCVTLWVVLTVLSLGRPVWSAVKVIQPYRVLSTNGTAQVKCLVRPRASFQQLRPASDQTPAYPHHDPEELRVTLLKGLHGTREFCSSFINITGQREPGVGQEGRVQCSAQMGEGAMEVTVSGLRAADTDLYRCKIEIFFPPPYRLLTGNGTLVHVLGSSDCPVPAQRQTAHRGDDEEGEEGGERTAPVSVPVVVLVILVIFVLIIIIYFQALQCERWRRETVPGGLHETDAAAFSCQNIS
ncbi:cytotoxic T-lymphocyte protein 4 [Clinocottus analis]|uniref:cytotoxic T-lymphocyte protein 4 n=1 Tax=Clinocottus analis TaxID=304258 RepID=UPI0035BF679A